MMHVSSGPKQERRIALLDTLGNLQPGDAENALVAELVDPLHFDGARTVL